MNKKVAVLFPAFGMGYKVSFPSYQDEYKRLLSLASQVVKIEERHFEKIANGIIEDDLQAHYFCYIQSCLISQILKKEKVPCDYVAPYSMGLFASLFYVSSLSFEEGLLLMDHTCRSALASVDKDKQYGMGAIIGLTIETVQELLLQDFFNIEVADISNEHVILISGIAQEIQRLLSIATEKGALQCKMLPIALPYHSRFIQNAQQRIQAYVEKLEIKPPLYPLISSIHQNFLTTPQEIKKELGENISHSINWLMTMNKLIASGVSVFCECGASDSLVKLLRFIKGDFESYHPRNFDKLFRLFKES